MSDAIQTSAHPGVYGVNGEYRFDGVSDNNADGAFPTPWLFGWRAFASREAETVQALEAAGYRVRR